MILLSDSEDPNQTANAQSDLGLRCPHMPEYTFSHGEARFSLFYPTSSLNQRVYIYKKKTLYFCVLMLLWYLILLLITDFICHFSLQSTFPVTGFNNH